jgi:nitroimidazol reductase NimA-like FMN-containing flavoprotein (pyridoxamine 5'-phosphate oxidase superfamily)
MIQILSEAQIERLLREERLARLGCTDGTRAYVVPVSYAYDKGVLYGHTKGGLKLRLLRVNPTVCVEVERIESAGNWQTVIAWGRFEELHGEAAAAGMERLITQLWPALGAAVRPMPAALKTELVSRALRDGVVFSITLTERTGRFERSTSRTSDMVRMLGHLPTA